MFLKRTNIESLTRTAVVIGNEELDEEGVRVVSKSPSVGESRRTTSRAEKGIDRELANTVEVSASVAVWRSRSVSGL